MRTLLVLALLAATAAASAQPDWRPTAGAPSVSLDVIAALGDDLQVADVDGVGVGTVETTTSALLVSGRIPVGPVTVVAELPFAYVNYSTGSLSSYGGFRTDESTGIGGADAIVGNPYVGVRVSTASASLEGGVRLPLSTGDPYNTFADASVVGPTLDPERFEAYLADIATLSLDARLGRDVAPGVRVEGRLAPALLTETGDATDCRVCDTVTNGFDVQLGYGVRVVADAGPARVHAGVGGRRSVTRNRFEAFDRDATLSLGASLVRAPVRPGVLVRVPVSPGTYFGTKAVVGLSLDVPLR